MHIHQVFLVPGYGHTSDTGEYVRGNPSPDGSTSQLDVVDAYLPAIIEELDCEGIRYTCLETRNGAGIPQSLRAQYIEANSVVIHCLAGWNEDRKRDSKNVTRITYGQSSSFPLADEVSEAVGQWGQNYVFGHKTANPRQDAKDALLVLPETKAVAIEPFALNGPDVKTYVRYLEQLGKVIARAVADHLNARGMARRAGIQLAPLPPGTVAR